MSKQRLAEVHVMYTNGNYNIIQTDDPQSFCEKLRMDGHMYICYPNDMPIPRNKKE